MEICTSHLYAPSVATLTISSILFGLTVIPVIFKLLADLKARKLRSLLGNIANILHMGFLLGSLVACAGAFAGVIGDDKVKGYWEHVYVQDIILAIGLCSIKLSFVAKAAALTAVPRLYKPVLWLLAFGVVAAFLTDMVLHAKACGRVSGLLIIPDCSPFKSTYYMISHQLLTTATTIAVPTLPLLLLLPTPLFPPLTTPTAITTIALAAITIAAEISRPLALHRADILTLLSLAASISIACVSSLQTLGGCGSGIELSVLPLSRPTAAEVNAQIRNLQFGGGGNAGISAPGTEFYEVEVMVGEREWEGEGILVAKTVEVVSKER